MEQLRFKHNYAERSCSAIVDIIMIRNSVITFKVYVHHGTWRIACYWTSHKLQQMLIMLMRRHSKWYNMIAGNAVRLVDGLVSSVCLSLLNYEQSWQLLYIISVRVAFKFIFVSNLNLWLHFYLWDVLIFFWGNVMRVMSLWEVITWMLWLYLDFVECVVYV